MKNNLGQKLTFSVLRSIWQDARLPYAGPSHFTRKQWLDDKAYGVYLNRFENAIADGLDGDDVNANDVHYTVRDEIERLAYNTLVGQFLVGLHHWFTDEPDYSRLHPYG